MDNPVFTRRARSRGLVSGMAMLLLQPATFFSTFNLSRAGTQWLWVAGFILVLNGASAVRRVMLQSATPTGIASISMSPSQTLTIALSAATTILIHWLIQALLLIEVSLLNGIRPRFTLNLQLVVWASLPLALMAGFQLLYYAVGGTVGQPGLSGLLVEWRGYDMLMPFHQEIVLAFASNLTLFFVWNLALLWRAARDVLNARWFATLFVIVIWMIVVSLLPFVGDLLRGGNGDG